MASASAEGAQKALDARNLRIGLGIGCLTGGKPILADFLRQLVQRLREQGWPFHAVLAKKPGSASQSPDLILVNRPLHDLRVEHAIGEGRRQAQNLGETIGWLVGHRILCERGRRGAV